MRKIEVRSSVRKNVAKAPIDQFDGVQHSF